MYCCGQEMGTPPLANEAHVLKRRCRKLKVMGVPGRFTVHMFARRANECTCDWRGPSSSAKAFRQLRRLSAGRSRRPLHRLAACSGNRAKISWIAVSRSLNTQPDPGRQCGCLAPGLCPERLRSFDPRFGKSAWSRSNKRSRCLSYCETRNAMRCLMSRNERASPTFTRVLNRYSRSAADK